MDMEMRWSSKVVLLPNGAGLFFNWKVSAVDFARRLNNCLPLDQPQTATVNGQTFSHTISFAPAISQPFAYIWNLCFIQRLMWLQFLLCASSLLYIQMHWRWIWCEIGDDVLMFALGSLIFLLVSCFAYWEWDCAMFSGIQKWWKSVHYFFAWFQHTSIYFNG